MQCDDPKCLCPHVAESPDEFLAWFTGVGKELNWVCRACAAKYPEAPSEWVPATEEWLSKYRDEVYWDGIRGSPEIRRRTTQMRFATREVHLGGEWGDFVDVQPCLGSPFHWHVLCKSGSLALFSSLDSSVISSCRLTGLKFEITEGSAICVSPNSDFVVVSESSRVNAALVDMKSGSVIRELSRGDYHSDLTQFPVAFFVHEGRTLLAAASDWNRLDVYDPSDDQLITERGPTRYVDGVRPPHYLDYFHGSLRVSPDLQTVVDNGWIWHPWGVLRSWDLSAWLTNPWESEDGPTSRALVSRQYYWEGPLCWVNDTRLAFWGWGLDDDWLMPAVVLMDLIQDKVLDWFPGPRVRMTYPRKPSESLFFDRYIFAVSDEEGTSVWDVEAGECLLADTSVKPWRYHPGSKEFLEVFPDGFKLSTLVE